MSTLRQNLDALLQLQQLDSERDKLVRQKNTLDTGANLTQAVAAAQSDYEHKAAELFSINGSLKDAELELASIEKKIKDYESKMRQGAVTNTREVMNFEKEFNQLNRQRAALDDKILNLMEKSESQTAVVHSAQNKVTSIDRDLSTTKESYHGELSKIESALGRMTASRSEIAKLVADSALLKRYEALRARPGNSGIAIARTTQSTCGACHMQIGTIAVTQAESGSQLAICENCGRIMA